MCSSSASVFALYNSYNALHEARAQETMAEVSQRNSLGSCGSTGKKNNKKNARAVRVLDILVRKVRYCSTTLCGGSDRRTLLFFVKCNALGSCRTIENAVRCTFICYQKCFWHLPGENIKYTQGLILVRQISDARPTCVSRILLWLDRINDTTDHSDQDSDPDGTPNLSSVYATSV
jgi:hypothetical protein